VPWVELPSGSGSLPLIIVHVFQRDAHMCSSRSCVDHGLPCLSSGSAPGEDVVKGVITPSACACIHTPPQPPLPHVWSDPPAPSPALRARRPRLPCARFSHAPCASAMPPPTHVRTPRHERHGGEGVGGGARGCPCTTRQEALPRRGHLAAGADDSPVGESTPVRR